MAGLFEFDAVLKALTGETSAEHAARNREIDGALRSLGLGAVADPATGLYLQQASRGLLVPRDWQPVPLDYLGVYTKLSDYASGDLLGVSAIELARHVVQSFCAQAPRSRLIELLAILNRGMAHPEVLRAFVEIQRSSLEPELTAKFDSVFKGERRVAVAPQTALAALRYILAMEEVEVVPTRPPESMVLLFVHAVAEGLASDSAEGEEKIAGIRASLAMEMVRNAIFNEHDDMYSGIARQFRLWRDYAVYGARLLGGRRPAEIAREAIGIDIEDFLALGFGFMSHAMAWRPRAPLYIPEGYFPNVDPAILSRFLQLVSSTPDEMKDCLQNQRSRWDFLAFQKRPVLRVPAGYLVIDIGLLFERVTSGLYWTFTITLRSKKATGVEATGP